jgi:hypothetical protein
VQPYRNPKSGVIAFTLNDTSIDIEFRDGKRYRYDHATPGPKNVRAMKRLALAGQGLATYINQHVRDRFAAKLPREATPPSPPHRPSPQGQARARIAAESHQNER